MKFRQYILPVVTGAMAGIMLISLGQKGMLLIYPLPAGTNFNDKEAFATAIALMPTAAFVLLLINYAVCSFLAGLIATFIARRATMQPAIVVGIVLTLAGLANVISIRHPLWFSIANCFIYLPFAYFGYLAARKKPGTQVKEI